MLTKGKRNMEDEMSRFEAEISSNANSTSTNLFVPHQLRPIIGSNTYNQVQQKLSQPNSRYNNDGSTTRTITEGGLSSTAHVSLTTNSVTNVISSVPPPPAPPTFISTFMPQLIQHQQQHHHNQHHHHNQQQQHHQQQHQQELPEKSYSSEPTPVVLSSAPKLYSNRPTIFTQADMPIVNPSPPVVVRQLDISTIQFDVTQKLKKIKAEKSGPNPIAEAAIQAAKASSALQNFQINERRKKDKKTIRTAGGQVWEDHSLADWSDDDFRIFCGDLGNDVNDELLTRTFNKYPSFMRAKVIRDKRTGKSKGFGFISFKEPSDFIKAMKEMDGRYVGSRPIKLRKSSWKQRSFDVVKRKEKEKTQLLQNFHNN